VQLSMNPILLLDDHTCRRVPFDHCWAITRVAMLLTVPPVFDAALRPVATIQDASGAESRIAMPSVTPPIDL
ncbi:hypothetical protein ACSTI3_23795, partial [Vibrio parahaemolyticus]